MQYVGLTRAGEEEVRTALQTIPYAPQKVRTLPRSTLSQDSEKCFRVQSKSAGSWKGGSFSELCERESVGRCRKTGQDVGL